jgi:hypothetical protein
MNTAETKKNLIIKYTGIIMASAWFFFVLWQWLAVPEYNLMNLRAGFHFLPRNIMPGRYFFSNLIFCIKEFSITVCFIAAIYGYGRFILLKFFTNENYSGLETWLVSSGLGFAVSGHLFLILVFCGILYPVTVITILIPGLVLLFISLIRNPPRFPDPEKIKKLPGTLSITEIILSVIVLFFLMLVLITAFSPDTEPDSLNYTLATPGWWILNHGMKDMPQHIYYNLFAFYAAIYAGAVSIGDELTAKLVNNYAVLVSVIGITVYYGKKFFNRQTVILTLAVICTSYSFLILSSVTQSDAISMMFSFLSLLLVLRDGDKKMKQIILPALFAGCAMASKAITVIFILCILGIIFYINRNDLGKASKKILVFTAVASLPVFPWLIKNQIYRGNPFFPFLSSMFGFDNTYDRDLVTHFMRYSDAFHGERFSFIKNFWNLIVSYPLIFNNHTQPLLLAMMGFIPFIYKKLSHDQTVLFIFTAVLFLIQLFFLSSARYFFPVYMLSTMFFAYFIYPVIEKNKAYMTAFTAILLFLSLSLFGEISRTDALAIPAGRLTYKEYLSENVYGGYYKAADMINSTLTDSARILINDYIGRSLYIKRNFHVTSYLDLYWYDIFAKNAGTAEDILYSLKENGFTHILENEEKITFSDDLKMLRKKKKDINKEKILSDFRKKYLKKIFTSSMEPGASVVYEILYGIDGSTQLSVNSPE